MHMRRSLYRFLTILTLLALLLGRASAIAGPVSSGEAEGPAPSTSRGVAVHGGAPRKDDVPGPGSDDAQVVEAFRAAPLMFIENVGQFDPRVRFQVRGASANLWLTSDALWVTVEEGDGERTREDVGFRSPSSADRETAAEPRTRRGVALKLSFRSANPSPRLEPFGRLETSVNYFIGNDPAGWRPNVPVWAGVRYVDIYPGVDLEVLSERGRWTWRLVAGESAAAALAPAPSPVALQVEGAEALAVDGGYVQATTALGKVALPLLEVQQQIWSPRAITPGIAGDTIYAPFASGGAIDDLLLSGQRASDLLYATFLGGGEGDWANEVAVDATGNAYVAGSTRSSDFPTTPGAYDTTHNESTDAFVARLNPSGSDLLYATFLGGDGSDYGDGVAVDATGNAYVTGSNGSSDFPTTSGAYDTTHNGGADVFVSKLNPSGSDLLYATFLGGGGDDRGKGIAVDGSGSAYVTGWTFSPDFPTTPEAYDTTYNGWYDAFVARVNPSGSALLYGTFLGGGGWDGGNDIAVDGPGNAYVVGWTASSDFPTTSGAYDTTHNGSVDAFVARVNPSGSDLFYATFLGAGDGDDGLGIAVDGSGNAYVTGSTSSPDFPTTSGAYGTTHNGGGDAFVGRLNPSGSDLLYATFLGGSGDDRGKGVAVDDSGNAYVTGFTESFDFPTTPGTYDTTHNGGRDAFVARLPIGAGRAYSISGHVHNGSGNPISVVTVWASGTYSATTDASGQYTITNVVFGTYSLAPATAGYFWSPVSRTASVPPDATGQDFTGRNVQKAVHPGGPYAVSYGDALTYTVGVIFPEDRDLVLYDRVPTYTTYISGSLVAAAGLIYEPVANAISGRLVVSATTPTTVSFAVQVEVTGTAESAVPIVNQACVHAAEEGLGECIWSNEVRSYTYVWSTYLPLVMKNH